MGLFAEPIDSVPQFRSLSKLRFGEIRLTQQPLKLLDQVRDAIRLKHYAYSTEKTYVQWAKRFVLYCNKRHPLEMGAKEISEFLTHLAAEVNVAASTQN